MFNLYSDCLRVEIAELGEKPNNQNRFDRAGYISDVVLDGGMHFGAAEPNNLVHPNSGGRGFCNEIRCDLSKEAKVGEYFPKFGIGLIRKEDEEKFQFSRTYKDIVHFSTSVEHDDQKAVFITEPMECLGYALKETKTVSVEENEVTMEITMENTGAKDLYFEEFCHNFISIDGMAVGSDYRLDMPQIYDLGYERLNNRRGFSGVMRGNGKGITFCEFTAIDTDYEIDCSRIEKTVPFEWKMSHLGAGAYVEGKAYFTPGVIAIWGVDHMLSPEVNNCIDLKSGETKTWKYSWKFGRL